MKTKKRTYSEAVARAEELIEEIGNPKQKIDDLYEKVKETNELLAFCRETLTKADEEVQKLLQ